MAETNPTNPFDFVLKDEMCEHFAWYYPKTALSFCMSSYPEVKIFEKFGIEEIAGDYFNPTITKPEHLANMTFSEFMDTVIEWTPELRVEMQKMVIEGVHDNFCTPESGPGIDHSVSYPDIPQAYQPPNQCV